MLYNIDLTQLWQTNTVFCVGLQIRAEISPNPDLTLVKLDPCRTNKMCPSFFSQNIQFSKYIFQRQKYTLLNEIILPQGSLNFVRKLRPLVPWLVFKILILSHKCEEKKITNKY